MVLFGGLELVAAGASVAAVPCAATRRPRATTKVTVADRTRTGYAMREGDRAASRQLLTTPESSPSRRPAEWLRGRLGGHRVPTARRRPSPRRGARLLRLGRRLYRLDDAERRHPVGGRPGGYAAPELLPDRDTSRCAPSQALPQPCISPFPPWWRPTTTFLPSPPVVAGRSRLACSLRGRSGVGIRIPARLQVVQVPQRGRDIATSG